MTRSLACLLSALILLSLGCSRNPPTYPVKGKVVFPSGANVRMGTIETKSRSLGLNARGTIQTDGTFELTTFSPGDGAVAGTHDCVVIQMVMHAEEFSGKVSSFGMIDPKHNSYSTSGLSFEVKPEGPNEVTLEVSPFRGKEVSDQQHKH